MAGKNNEIHFIITGGTIDSHYDSTKDTAVPLKNSCIPDFIKSLKLYTETRFTEVCMKDSRSLDKKDIEEVLKRIEESKENRIIVTHGTYTMPDTARYLKTNLKQNNKVIVLTGSMIPLTGFTPSDAPFNLGYSIAKLDDLEPGVYICMNGRVFKAEEVTKSISEGRFTSIFGEK